MAYNVKITEYANGQLEVVTYKQGVYTMEKYLIMVGWEKYYPYAAQAIYLYRLKYGIQ